MSDQFLHLEIRGLNVAQGVKRFTIKCECGGIADTLQLSYYGGGSIRLQLCCSECSCWGEGFFSLNNAERA